MNVNNLKIGDIIITDVNEMDGDQYPKVIVVGSSPLIAVGQSASFFPVLKRNRRENYYIAANMTTINLGGENLNGVVAVLSTMEDAFNFDVSHAFDIDVNEDWVEKVKKKIAIAFKKRNWVLTPVEANPDGVEGVFEQIEPLATSRFYITVEHREDFDVESVLNDVLNETDDDDVHHYTITNLD